MYAGTTFRNKSGGIVGVHQRVDRIARRLLKANIKESQFFPTIESILHFEGHNGPDGIKRKTPSRDEPWHFVDPYDDEDNVLLGYINDHIHNLEISLKNRDEVKSAFEAAWLAHAIVDGLTPAHHYALDDKIEALWGKPHYERMSIKEKNIIKGINRRDTISKNWQYWGFKGVFTAHIAFELGVASTLAPLRFTKLSITKKELEDIKTQGFEAVYKKSMREIHDLDMYNQIVKNGWTHRLALQTKKELVPVIAKMVMFGWYSALPKGK